MPYTDEDDVLNFLNEQAGRVSMKSLEWFLGLQKISKLRVRRALLELVDQHRVTINPDRTLSVCPPV